MQCITSKIKTNSYGFTIIELLVVMSISSVIAAIGLYSISSYMPKQRQIAAARTMKADLVKGRIHAIKSRMDQTVEISNSSYDIKNGSDIFLSRNFEIDFGWAGIELRTTNSPTLNFDGTISDIATIDINCADNDPLSITMTITGNITIE